MQLSAQIAVQIAQKLSQLQDTAGSFTEAVGDIFYQAAADDQGQVLVELPAARFLPEQAVPRGGHEALLRLGFNRPISSMPNWWILIEDGQPVNLLAAATAMTAGLLEVFGIEEAELAAAMGLSDSTRMPEPTPPPLPTGGEGEPLVVDGSLGEVRLYPNGYATLEGAPLTAEPVREWRLDSDGEIAITFEPAGDRTFPHVGFVENTERTASLLRRFAPNRDDRHQLNHRLAVAEYYPLVAILTGTIYHYDLGRAVWDLERQHRDYPPRSIAGWPMKDRLEAATQAASHLWWSQSADNSRERRDDEATTWQSIQKWVRISPWRDEFDFEIVPTAPPPFHVVPGPELQIRRLSDERLACGMLTMARLGRTSPD